MRLRETQSSRGARLEGWTAPWFETPRTSLWNRGRPRIAAPHHEAERDRVCIKLIGNRFSAAGRHNRKTEQRKRSRRVPGRTGARASAGREISEQEKSRIGDVGIAFCHSCERGRGVLDSIRLEATTARRVARK